MPAISCGLSSTVFPLLGATYSLQSTAYSLFNGSYPTDEEVLEAVERLRRRGGGQVFVDEEAERLDAVLEAAKKAGIGSGYILIEEGSSQLGGSPEIGESQDFIFSGPHSPGNIRIRITQVKVQRTSEFIAIRPEDLEGDLIERQADELKASRQALREKLDRALAAGDERAASKLEDELVSLGDKIERLLRLLDAARTPGFDPGVLVGTRFVNQQIHRVNPSEYALDRDLGIVKFRAPRGRLEFLHVDQIDKSRLLPAHVEVHFAAEDKPHMRGAPLGPGQEEHRFRFDAVWSKGAARPVDRLLGDQHATPLPMPELVLCQAQEL